MRMAMSEPKWWRLRLRMDEVPVITGPTGGHVSVLEGNTSIYTFSANESVTWGVSGTDEGRFKFRHPGFYRLR